MADEQEIVLVPFGPTREVPKGHRWCMNCDGSGKTWDHDKEEEVTCIVCQGKGHWNSEDIRRYHILAPEICRESCGAEHLDIDLTTDIGELPDIKSIIAETDELIRKYGK